MSKPRTPVIDAELGEQLSALMDGELDAERSRFLLRRLEGDPALRAAWERWHLVSGSLKGRLSVQVDAGFLARVREGIEAGHHADPMVASVDEDVSASASRTAPGWLRWAAGGAIAASVAVVAVMATQPRAPLAEPGQELVDAIPAEPYIVAPSRLSEADLRPRLRAPAQTVSVQQRGPLLQTEGGMPVIDQRVPAYLILEDGRLRQGGLGDFLPYVDAAEGHGPGVRAQPETR